MAAAGAGGGIPIPEPNDVIYDNAYLIVGHSEESTILKESMIVPKDCLFVYSAMCGAITLLGYDTETIGGTTQIIKAHGTHKLFHKYDPDNIDDETIDAMSYMSPLSEYGQKSLSKKVGPIVIKKPDDTYNDNIYTLFFFYTSENAPTLFTEEEIEANVLKFIPSGIIPAPFDINILHDIKKVTVDTPLDELDLPSLYKYSVFPTPADINKYMLDSFIEEIIGSNSALVLELFGDIEGVPKLINDIHTIWDDNKVMERMRNLYDMVRHKLTVGLFLNYMRPYFELSVKVTQSEIFDFKNPVSPLINPGIFYNFSCRVIRAKPSKVNKAKKYSIDTRIIEAEKYRKRIAKLLVNNSLQRGTNQNRWRNTARRHLNKLVKRGGTRRRSTNSRRPR